MTDPSFSIDAFRDLPPPPLGPRESPSSFPSGANRVRDDLNVRKVVPFSPFFFLRTVR